MATKQLFESGGIYVSNSIFSAIYQSLKTESDHHFPYVNGKTHIRNEITFRLNLLTEQKTVTTRMWFRVSVYPSINYRHYFVHYFVRNDNKVHRHVAIAALLHSTINPYIDDMTTSLVWEPFTLQSFLTSLLSHSRPNHFWYKIPDDYPYEMSQSIHALNIVG